jgi:hypothetical protein
MPLQGLQEPLAAALGVLEEVEACRQALVAADVARVAPPAGFDAWPCLRSSHLPLNVPPTSDNSSSGFIIVQK